MNVAAAKGMAQKRSVLDIGSRLELFVDRYLIDRLEGTKLVLHPPTPREVAIRFDAPWEGPSSTYVTVLKDADRYRAYYRGSSLGRDGVGERTCYAESQDGIAWTKPMLGICEFEGSSDNNVIWDGFGCHNFMVFVDARPGVPGDERYKAIPSGAPGRPLKRIIALASPDGIHWRQVQEEPIITQPAMDHGADLAFWDTERGQYVAYLRGWRTRRGDKPISLANVRHAATQNVYVGEGLLYRQILRCTSPDFLHWSEPAFVDFGDTPLEHFYTNAVQPYFRAPHIYLSFPKRFWPERVVVPEHPSPGLSEGVLLSSRDGVHFERTFMEAFLRPGRDRENWTHRNMMIAPRIVPTAPDELSIYWVEHYCHPTCRLRRGTLRLDGFVSVNAPYAGGELVTHPLRFEGSELILNYATSAAGSVRVEVLDQEGRPLPGYSLSESAELYGDEIEQVVSWKKGSDISQVSGETVQLRFAMQDADLYSIQFR
jgi:hypothetical protein